VKPHNYTNLSLRKALNIYNGEKTASSTKTAGKLVSSLQKTETRSMFIRINSKWIKDLNIRLQTVKLVQERVGNTLELIGIGKDFVNEPQQPSK
jgi:hypothetical protein